MKKLLYILVLLPMFANGQTGVKWDRYFFTGSMKFGGGLQGYANATLAAQDSNSYAEPCAFLEIGNDTSTRGLLLPRVLVVSGITSPKKGLITYEISTAHLKMYNGVSWVRVDSAGGSSGAAYDSVAVWTAINEKVPITRTITINGVTQDLSANRTWSVVFVDSTIAGDGLIETGNTIYVDSSKYRTVANSYNKLQVDTKDAAKLNITDTTGKWLPIGTTFVSSETDPLSLHIADTGAAFALYYKIAGYGLLGSGHTVRADTGATGLATQYDLTQINTTPYTAGTGIGIVGTVISNTGVITEVDGSVTNEVQSLSSGKVGTAVTVTPSLSGGATTFSVADADSSASNEIQTLGRSGSNITLTGSTSVIDSNSNYAAGTNISITGAYPTFTINATSGGTGDVVGPASATDLAITRYNGTTGKLIQNSTLIANNNGGIQFPQKAPVSYAIGQMAFDTTCDCMVFDGLTSATRMNIGQELWENVYNNGASTITAGQAVYITGGITIAGEVYATVGLAQANAAATSVCIGLATENISANTRGKVTTNGTVHGLNTSGLSVGNVFVSSSIAGGLTNTAPSAPNYRYRVGVVSSVDAATGTIKVTGSTGALGNGTANQVFGMNSAGTAQEVKSITAANGSSVNNAANSITIGTPFRNYRYFVTGVNLLASGNTTIFTTDANKGRFIITSYSVHITSWTTASGSVTFNMGFTGVNYLDNVATVSLNLGTQINAVGKYSIAAPTTNLSVPASTAEVFRVTTPGGGTTAIATIYVTGFYETE